MVSIHQLAKSGSPIVWGGAPAIFDMRQGTTPMGAIETAMIDAAYAQCRQALRLPYSHISGRQRRQIVDAQACRGSGVTAVVGALAGINMISVLECWTSWLASHPRSWSSTLKPSPWLSRLLEGMHVHTETLATAMFAGINFKGDFLKQPITRKLFGQRAIPALELVIDRGSTPPLAGRGQPGYLRPRPPSQTDQAGERLPPSRPRSGAGARASIHGRISLREKCRADRPPLPDLTQDNHPQAEVPSGKEPPLCFVW